MTTRQYVEKNLVLKTQVGSMVHGTGIPGQEDQDFMGIYIEERLDVFGHGADHAVFRTAAEGERSTPDDIDETYYSLRKWLRLAEGGNPTVLLPLFTPSHQVEVETFAGSILRTDRVKGMFVSKKAGKHFSGYAKAQVERLNGRRSGMPYRPEVVEKYGFDTKFAMHAARLVYQGYEYLSTGNLVLPITETEEGRYIASIRRGDVTLADALDFIDYWDNRLEILIQTGDLPEVADPKAIAEVSYDLHTFHWQHGALTVP